MRLILTTPSSGMQAGGDAGKMGPALLFLSPPWQLFGWSLGWKDCCYGWLLLDLLTIWRMHCSIAVSCVMLPTVPDLRRRKTRQVALHRLLFAEPAGPAGAAQEEHLLLQRSASAVELHHISFACLRESVYTWLQNVHWLDNSLPPYYLRQAGRGGAEKRGTRAATTMPSFRSYSGSQTSQVLSRWTETTWPASLGWPGPSGPAAQLVLNWRTALACFARRARGPSRCHADRLPGLLLSAGLMAPGLQTSQPDLVCSAAPLASVSIDSANCPLQKSRPCKNPDFRTLQKFHTLQNLAKIQIFALTKPCKNQFVKPCETLQNCLYVKRQIAKPCETLRNTAKPYLRPYLRKCAKAAVKLAKACEIIFAKTCQWKT